jgi:hypothetical protein
MFAIVCLRCPADQVHRVGQQKAIAQAFENADFSTQVSHPQRTHSPRT